MMQFFTSLLYIKMILHSAVNLSESVLVFLHFHYFKNSGLVFGRDDSVNRLVLEAEGP